jgi:MoaA/NifB/PqqE/SkfB family radical SAM enzyme
MRNPRTRPVSFQRCPAVRLRREAWGGIAFDRAGGDLLELDDAGFAVLAALSTAQTLAALRQTLHRQGQPARFPELASFLRTLESRALVQSVAADAPPLLPDPWAEVPRPCAGRLRAPLVAHWAVTYRCNLHCSFCYSESGPYRDAGPAPEVRRRLVERLAAWGVLEVALGGGEPTLLSDFADLLAAIRRAGMVPNVTTNGTVHQAGVLRALAEHAGVVHLSADRPELLDAARGEGVFGRLRETATQLRRAGVRQGVNLLVTPENITALRRSLEAALDLGVQAVTLLRPKGAWAAAHWPGFPGARDLDAVAAGVRAFVGTTPPLRLYVDTALRSEWADLGLFTDPEPEVLGCGGGQRHVAVTPEGDVYPCSHARRPVYRMGNLLTDESERLWDATTGRGGLACYLRDCAGTRCACRATAEV